MRRARHTWPRRLTAAGGKSPPIPGATVLSARRCGYSSTCLARTAAANGGPVTCPFFSWGHVQAAHRTKKESLFSFRKTGSIILATSYSRKTFRQTTIGATAFHFRVRDGNGWCRCAMVTRIGTVLLSRFQGPCHSSFRRVKTDRRMNLCSLMSAYRRKYLRMSIGIKPNG